MSIKLSEAVRLGPTICPAIYGPVFQRDWLGNVCGACRIGATAIAAGFKPARLPRRDGNVQDIVEVRDFMRETRTVACIPVSRKGVTLFEMSFTMWTDVAGEIAQRHEVGKQTADQIADWVETIEAQYEARMSQVESQPTTTVEVA